MTKIFICDSCSQPIMNVREGWVEWHRSTASASDPQLQGLRLVHHSSRCQYDEDALWQDKRVLMDGALADFLGDDGLMRLLTFIHEGEFSNNDEVLEMIKRLHVNGYEAAFRNFKNAIYSGVFEPNTPENYHWQSDIQATIDEFGEQ